MKETPSGGRGGNENDQDCLKTIIKIRIKISDWDGYNIKNLQKLDGHDIKSTDNEGNGIRIDESSQITLDNVRLDNNAEYGFYGYGSSDFEIRHGTMDSNGMDGIILDQCRDFTLKSFRAIANEGGGFWFFDSLGGTVEDIKVNENWWDGIF